MSFALYTIARNYRDDSFRNRAETVLALYRGLRLLTLRGDPLFLILG
jgi:hypothetical protein